LDSNKRLQSQFASNIILLLVINFLIKPIYILGIDAEVQDTLGDETYGLYFSLFNFCFLFQIVLDIGIHNYNSKHLSQNRSQIASIFPGVIGTKLVLVFCFFLVVILAGMMLGYPVTYFATIVGVAGIFALQSMYLYLRSNFSAAGFFRTDSYLSALDKLLMILVIGYFVYVEKNITIPKFIFGQLLAISLACIVVIIMLARKFTLSVHFSVSDSMSLLKNSWPFALVVILMTLYTRMDGVMLERLLDDKARSAGVYAKSFRLLDAINVIGYLFAMLLLPMYAKLLGDKSDVNPLVKSATGLLFTLATFITLATYFYAEELMGLLYSDLTTEHIEVFRLLMLTFWFMSMSYLFGSLITASGNLRHLNLLLVGGIVINWGLNLYFIPSQGARGAGLATLVTQGIIFFGQFILAKKMFSLRYPADYIFKVMIFLASAVGILYLFSKNLSILWFFELIMAGIIILIISILLGFFRFNLANEN